MPKNVVQTLMGADMDITDYKLMSKDKLKEQILEDVKATQMFVNRHLPDKLLMTFDQFQILQDDLQEIANTEMRLYVTPLNVMEVHIVDKPEVVDLESLIGVKDKDEILLEEGTDGIES